MRNYIIILISIISFSANSQELAPIYGDTANTGQQINISSFNYYASNSFNNNLINKFIYGGEIDNELKAFNESKLGKLNSIGGEFEQKIEYINYDLNLFKKYKNIGFVVGIEDINFMSANINSDLYKTIFNGNQDYLGDTMDFSYTHAQYQHYKKISVGFVTRNNDTKIKLSYVNGNQSINFRSGNTWMYSSPQSDSIKFNLNGEGKMTDSTSSYFEAKGHGFAFDLEHNFVYTNKNDKRQVLNLKLNNFGAIFWDNATTFYTVDSSNVYTGFEFNQIINQDSTTEYSIDTLGIVNYKRSYAELLPFEISIQKLADRNSEQKLQLTFGLKAIMTSDYRPYIFVGGYYAPIKNIGLSARVSYGGFGGLKAGLSANYWIKDKLEIGIGTFDLIGVISNQYGYGKSLNFNANFKF